MSNPKTVSLSATDVILKDAAMRDTKPDNGQEEGLPA